MTLILAIAASHSRPGGLTMPDDARPVGSGGIVPEGLDDLDTVGFLPLIREYVESLRVRLGAMATARTAGDLRALAGGAGWIRGNAALYGFGVLSDAAGALEDGIRTGADPTLIDARFESLAWLVERVMIGAQGLPPGDHLGREA